MNKTEDMVFYAAGDIAPWRDDPATIFRHVKPVLKQGDLAFCQLEACISDRGVRTPQATAVFDENTRSQGLKTRYTVEGVEVVINKD
jgi:hypothetical protein